MFFKKLYVRIWLAVVLAMPNTQPPMSRVSGAAQDGGWSIERYLADLRAAGAGADAAVF